MRLLRGMIPTTWSTATDRMGVYQRALAPYIGSAYSKSEVNAALRDERLGRALFALAEATSRVDQDHPKLARLTVPVWMIVPLRAMVDHGVRSRVAQTIGVLKEAMGGVRQFSERVDLTRSLVEAAAGAQGLTAFIHDPDIPTAVAKRLLAGVRSRVTMDMVQGARHHHAWKTSDTKRGLLDWSNDLLSFIGLIASQPGVSIPSLPCEYVFDSGAALENHRRRRQRLVADARQAAADLNK